MTITDDPSEFRSRWHEHVNQLDGLKHTLHPDDWDELDDAIDALHDVVDDATDQYEKDQQA